VVHRGGNSSLGVLLGETEVVHAILIAVRGNRKLFVAHTFGVEVDVYHDRSVGVLVLIEVHYVISVHQKVGRPFRV
jgi:hypothetical protein